MTKPEQALGYTEALHLMDIKTELTAVISVIDQSRTRVQFILPKSYSMSDFKTTLGPQILKKALIKTSADIFGGAMVRKDLPVYVFYLPADFWPQYCFVRKFLQIIHELAQYPPEEEVDTFIRSQFLTYQQKAQNMNLAPELLALPTATTKTLKEYLSLLSETI